MNPGYAPLSTRDRIIRSLFTEKDASGVALESYLTHVKIFEDVQYPASPPPQPTPAENLKERYILLSVKSNGRVRMHKARGNDNGTFQIGKTWNLDDLQKVHETDRRGMIVTLLKPYYWTMDAGKEKYNFVSALIKIYKKYTGGRMFELLGFDPGLFQQERKQPQETITTPPPRAVAQSQSGTRRSMDIGSAQRETVRQPSGTQLRTGDPRVVSSNFPTSATNRTASQSTTPSISDQIELQHFRATLPGLAKTISNDSASRKASTEQRADDGRNVAPRPVRSVPLVPDVSAPFKTPEIPQSPMSPPPSKSARRQANGVISTSRVLQDRIGMQSPANSVARSDGPDPPNKSGARSNDSPGLDRAEIPWSTPKQETQGHFPEPSISAGNDVSSKPRSAPDVHSESDMEVESELEHRKVSNSSTISDDEFNEAAYFDEVLSNFKWTSSKGTKDLAYRLQDELAALEAANIHAIVESDVRVGELMQKLDHGIAQCDDMSNLLTLYEFELASCAADVKHIESQNKGLQVQTANQKALIAEISNVLTNITISDADLDVLRGRGGSFEAEEGIRAMEKGLVNLYRALLSLQDEAGAEQSMSAMKKKRKEYEQQSTTFMLRLAQFFGVKFQAALNVKAAGPKGITKVLPGHEDGFITLYNYSTFTLYAHQVEKKMYTDLMRKYASTAKAAWRESIATFAAHWRDQARKATAEDNEVLFTSARDAQSTGAIRTATIKRTNTLAKTIRGSAKNETGTSDRIPASEVFRVILDNFAVILANEQNFLVTFFHLSSTSMKDLPEYVASKPVLTLELLDEHRQIETDRTLAKEKYIMMESIFGWIYADLVHLVDHLCSLDVCQSVGMLKALEVVIFEWSGSDQEFMLKTIVKLKDRVSAIFDRFVKEQIKAIKEFKATSKKRGGILPVFDLFPEFLRRLEDQLADDSGSQPPLSQLEIRSTTVEAYDQVNKAMFESVRSIASAGTVITHTTNDPEDKDALNYHILMIENMHQYLAALNAHDDIGVLGGFIPRASEAYKTHLSQYSKQIVLRPIGRLKDYSDGVSRVSNTGDNPLTKSAYSQSSLKRLLSDFEERDLRRGIQGIWKRVDKHFGNGSDEELIGAVWSCVQNEYLTVIDEFIAMLQNIYPGTEIDMSKKDIIATFKKRDS